VTPNPSVFVAAGSNVDPQHHLAHAARELTRAFGEVRFSPWYRNSAAGFDGAEFINFAAGFTTDAPVHEVRERLRAIEALCGRSRTAPRTVPPPIDLDLLLYGDLVCNEPGLTLPRPEILERAYVLGPLADIAPDLRHPTAGLTISELWARFDRTAHPLVRVEAALP
jgi:2-amino-4-hydroxy-6-hydroxymethyldihydropteridine diphosphokinase